MILNFRRYLQMNSTFPTPCLKRDVIRVCHITVKGWVMCAERWCHLSLGTQQPVSHEPMRHCTRGWNTRANLYRDASCQIPFRGFTEGRCRHPLHAKAVVRDWSWLLGVPAVATPDLWAGLSLEVVSPWKSRCCAGSHQPLSWLEPLGVGLMSPDSSVIPKSSRPHPPLVSLWVTAHVTPAFHKWFCLS